MIESAQIKTFYETRLPQGIWKGLHLVAPCPFCKPQNTEKSTRLVVKLDPEDYFCGYFRCLNGCVPGGFHFHFARLLGLENNCVPGFDPDPDLHTLDIPYPSHHLGPEMDKNASLMGREQHDYFARFGVAEKTLKELRVGFNGRYLVYPYTQENGYAYAARCVLPNREQDHFWHGNADFFNGPAAVYNGGDIGRCEGGALFITEGELNTLILKELGYPAIAVPSAEMLGDIAVARLTRIEQLFVLVANTPEARLAARNFAVQVGFKVRIVAWPDTLKPGRQLSHLAADPEMNTRKELHQMIRQARSFSPFSTPEKEHRRFKSFLEKEKGKSLLGLETGFAKLDRHLEGLRGISIMGGPPKAGKSCFFMQISTEVARRSVPVIYYDFENGRDKIYLRTLVRWTQMNEKVIRSGAMNDAQVRALHQAQEELAAMLAFFRVVHDRHLNPDIMRRHIDFIRHETRKDDVLIVIDSLHKLPFRDLSERRTGIDFWLRELEAVRDQSRVCFLVISELSRGKGGGYGQEPDLSSFKESGDIEYSADNAMILMPDWGITTAGSEQPRKSILWMAASREAPPGRVAEYALEYPYWRFKEL
jgi:replicative DNA helicase